MTTIYSRELDSTTYAAVRAEGFNETAAWILSSSAKLRGGAIATSITPDLNLLDSWELLPNIHRTGACGLSAPKGSIAQLEQLFEQDYADELTEDMVGPKITTDGVIPVHELALDLIYELRQLEHFGVKFEAPTFEGVFVVNDTRVVEKDGNHLQVSLKDPRSNKCFVGIWLFFETDANNTFEANRGDKARVIYSLQENRNLRSVNLQFMVKTIIKVEE